MVRVAGFGSKGPEFKSGSAVELIPGVVNSACRPSEVGKMSASMLVSCRSDDPSRIVPNSQGDCLSRTNALCTECGPNILLQRGRWKAGVPVNWEEQHSTELCLKALYTAMWSVQLRNALNIWRKPRRRLASDPSLVI